jgi:hypothetical protein
MLGVSIREGDAMREGAEDVDVVGRSGGCGCGGKERRMWMWWEGAEDVDVMGRSEGRGCDGKERRMWMWWEGAENVNVIMGRSGEC